jgi:hypothetical protein
MPNRFARESREYREWKRKETEIGLRGHFIRVIRGQ